MDIPLVAMAGVMIAVEALQQHRATINGREAFQRPTGTSGQIPGLGGVKHKALGRRMNGGRNLLHGSKPLEGTLGLAAPHPAPWHSAAARVQVLLALQPAAPVPVTWALQAVAPAPVLLVAVLPGPRCAADIRTPRRSPYLSQGLGRSPDLRVQGGGSNQAIVVLQL